MLNRIFQKQSDIDEELISTLRLIRSNNIGAKTYHNLLNYFGSPKNIIENISDFMKRAGKNNFTLIDESKILREVELTQKFGANFLNISSDNYPSLLKHIADPPPILIYKGDLSHLDKDIVAIVGSRNASINGLKFSSKIASELSQENCVIASGLARGIDTAAHKATIPSTIAVIASGIDKFYPEENKKLQEKIAAEGLLLTEIQIGTSPQSRYFPQRNRIISGLSKAVIVIEASLKSGSLITAKYAIEQNREIFACPGYPMDPRSKGCNMLIKQGAALLESHEEIIKYLNTNKNIQFEENNDNFIQDKQIKIDESLLNKGNREKILSLLSFTPTSIEELQEYSNLPFPIITTILLELELDDKIVYQPFNKYSLKN